MVVIVGQCLLVKRNKCTKKVSKVKYVRDVCSVVLRFVCCIVPIRSSNLVSLAEGGGGIKVS